MQNVAYGVQRTYHVAAYPGSLPRSLPAGCLEASWSAPPGEVQGLPSEAESGGPHSWRAVIGLGQRLGELSHVATAVSEHKRTV